MTKGGKKKGEKVEKRKFDGIWFIRTAADFFLWGLFLFFTFTSRNRIRWARKRKEYQSSKLDDYLYSYLYLCRRQREFEDEVRRSVLVHAHVFRSTFSSLIAIPDKSIGRTSNGNDFAKWHNKTYLSVEFVSYSTVDLKKSSDYSNRCISRDILPNTRRPKFLRASTQAVKFVVTIIEIWDNPFKSQRQLVY